MNMRQLKRLKHLKRVATLVISAAVPQKVITLYEVRRNKDQVLVATVDSAAEAEALVLKAKAAKKASLVFSAVIA